MRWRRVLHTTLHACKQMVTACGWSTGLVEEEEQWYCYYSCCIIIVIFGKTFNKTYSVKRLPGVKSHQFKRNAQTRSKWMMDGVPNQFKKSQRRGYVVQCWTSVPLSIASVAKNAWAMPEPVPEASKPYKLLSVLCL